MSNRISPLHLVLLLLTGLVFAWSAWRPYDRLTWWLEVAPGILGAAILITTYSDFRFTTLVYTLIALHIMLLCVGGHYTYARVPIFNWIEPYFGWHRNHFDRLGPPSIDGHVWHGCRGKQQRRWPTRPQERGAEIRNQVVRRVGAFPSSFSSAWELARITSCSNGLPRSSPDPPRPLFSAPRVMCGIRRKTCFSP